MLVKRIEQCRAQHDKLQALFFKAKNIVSEDMGEMREEEGAMLLHSHKKQPQQGDIALIQQRRPPEKKGREKDAKDQQEQVESRRVWVNRKCLELVCADL